MELRREYSQALRSVVSTLVYNPADFILDLQLYRVLSPHLGQLF